MSKVVLLFFAPDIYTISCYYSQLSTELTNAGHDVLVTNTAYKKDHVNNIWSGNDEFSEEIEERIIGFKPDLIMSFNNVSTRKVYSAVNCPILILEGDAYEAFPNKHLMKEFADQIYIGIFTKYRFKIWHEIIPFLPKDRFIYFKNSSSLQPDLRQEQDVNISIIATILGIPPHHSIVQSFVKNYGNPEATKRLHQIIKKAHYNITSITPHEYELLNATYVDLFHYISYLKRAYVLNNLADLGLEVRGKFYGLEYIYAALPDLAACLNPKEIVSRDDNESFYNRSKISINVHFAHNIDNPEVSGYSWRVCDIMRTNACLVSVNCNAIKEDFGKWVNIPMFSNRHEAYDICKKLLNDEPWRKSIVTGSQLAIKEGGFTFFDRIKEMEEIFNLKSTKNRKGNCDFLLPKIDSEFIEPSIPEIGESFISKVASTTLQTATSEIKLSSTFKKIRANITKILLNF
jgi:hypothetical protein